MSQPAPTVAGVRSVHQNAPIGAIPPKPTAKQVKAQPKPVKKSTKRGK